MKKIALAMLIGISQIAAQAQSLAEDKLHLQNLLAERAKNFSEYTESIQKRSGIFGNKTKGDIAKSNEILIDIVTLDNKIMDALNRTLSYKTFEKATGNYSARECEMKLKQSMQVTDTLMKQLTVLEERISKRDTAAVLYKVLFYLALAGCILLSVMLKRKALR